MRMMPIYLCLHYNRTKQDSKNYKNEWEIRGTDITHTEKATDITAMDIHHRKKQQEQVMQKILKLFCRKQKSKEKN